MSEMVERVARALCGYEEALHAERYTEQSRWDGRTDLGREEYRKMARAAIAAMWEPTESAVLSGARAAADQHYYKQNVWDRPGNIDDDVKQDFVNGMKYGWQAMIDEALRETAE